MIRITYSTEPYEELELEGSKADLLALRQAITGLSRPELPFTVETGFNPAPYQHVLSGLGFRVTDGLLHVTVQNHTLCISGKKEFLGLFAENLPYDAEQTAPVPYHVHFDRIGREGQVAENSLDLVMTMKE